jgi:hypothetical protein
MVNGIRGLSCCGGVELIGINTTSWTPSDSLQYYAREYELHRNSGTGGKAFVTFAYAWDVSNKGDGQRTKTQGKSRLLAFKKFVEDNKLGDCHIMPKSQYNPNYGKRIRIQAGILVPNNKAISKYFVDNKLLKLPSGWVY